MNKEQKIKQQNPRRCYYNDAFCEGEIVPVNSFKKYLCLKCAKEDNGMTEEVLDHDFNVEL